MRLRSVSLASIALILVLTSLSGTVVVTQLLPVRGDRWSERASLERVLAELMNNA